MNKVLTVITYADQGLGHLRVSKAIGSASLAGTEPILYAPEDKTATLLHKISSTNAISRKLLQMSQDGIGESLFAFFYKQVLRLDLRSFEKRTNDLFAKVDEYDEVVFITTHFGLAHQLSMLKPRFCDTQRCKIKLVVVVTDDSPQKLWYVPRADLTIVPSDYTKSELSKLAGSNFEIKVNPYPINSFFYDSLNKDKYSKRVNMSQGVSKYINVSIPISGAAVGLEYSESLIGNLKKLNDKYKFFIVSRRNDFTKNFLNKYKNDSRVETHSSKDDMQVIKKYDDCYRDNVILFEVTKPSEQCFKALANPKQTGGSILLLANPVGRQEYDNLNFLIHNDLIPDEKTQKLIFRNYKNSEDVSDKILNRAKNWRGLRLPDSPKTSAQFIQWGIENKLFYQMTLNNQKTQDGAKMFWDLIK